MTASQTLIEALGYVESPFWLDEHAIGELSDHAYRAAKEAGIRGLYSFRTSPGEFSTLNSQAAVYVVEARDANEARAIHRSLWNLGNAPFVIMVLPDHIRVYTCFSFDPHHDTPLRQVSIHETAEVIAAALDGFRATNIDNGRLWQEWGPALSGDTRIDRHLLNNLRTLSKILV